MIDIVDGKIDPETVLAKVRDPQCGAEVLFVGTTRQWTQRETIAQQAIAELEIESLPAQVETEFLIYECYREMALAQMQDLAVQAKERWPIKRLAIVHRVGRVLPMEASVVVAVSCPHRREAFQAAEWLMHEIKHEVPIWKQEHYVQIGSQWIHPTAGSCRCEPSKKVNSCNASDPQTEVKLAHVPAPGPPGDRIGTAK
ncbi:MAG: molybdenum cofactor biosynthesis protein MoaE [Planctomycetales bacterium]|nr:molybdenum cofactor biosynthesis protein MoaE [Planctomycetales bacterium]